jgi:hypothetical protein
LKAQEDGILEASIASQNYRKVQMRRARLAQVEYLSKMHDLMRDAQGQQIKDEDLIIEQFKIEDAIFPELDVEKEHII